MKTGNGKEKEEIFPSAAGFADDAAMLQAAIDLAAAVGARLVIPRENPRTGKEGYEVARALLLPSGADILLDGSTLTQADGTADNLFRNAATYRDVPDGKNPQQDIAIRGKNGAVLDGGNHNGLTEATSGKDGRPHVIANNTVFLHNIDGFAIEDLTVRRQRWWAFHLAFVRNGVIRNIRFEAPHDVPNRDGIDLRLGCHDIRIENITGYCGDDVVALSGFLTGTAAKPWYFVPDLSTDIYNITISDVCASGCRAVVALRNHDGIKLHDVTVKNISQATDVPAEEDALYAVLRIGQDVYAGRSRSVLGDTCRITAENIRARRVSCGAVMINMTLADSRISDVYAGEGCPAAVTTGTDWGGTPYGAEMRDCLIENVTFAGKTGSALDFRSNTPGSRRERVTVRNVGDGEGGGDDAGRFLEKAPHTPQKLLEQGSNQKQGITKRSDPKGGRGGA